MRQITALALVMTPEDLIEKVAELLLAQKSGGWRTCRRCCSRCREVLAVRPAAASDVTRYASWPRGAQPVLDSLPRCG